MSSRNAASNLILPYKKETSRFARGDNSNQVRVSRTYVIL